ncbi:hypothetical protein BC828DRAFT_38531 [Blastocladiella britannica]|nr:hypothetical protein BC828DRAFT_38531 [Blastocladiella britannica]
MEISNTSPLFPPSKRFYSLNITTGQANSRYLQLLYKFYNPHSWNYAAFRGYTSLVKWAIAQGHIEELDCVSALLSANGGDTSVRDWWIASQPNQEAVMAALINASVPERLTRCDSIGTLNWWWAYTGSKLPEPASFAKISDAALSGCSIIVIVKWWWWAHFLEHHMPEHFFGTVLRRPREITFFKCAEVLDWYWCHYHEMPEYFAHQDGSSHGFLFTIASKTTLPIFQWAVEKCAVLGSQKLTLKFSFISECIHDCRVDLLDLTLHSETVLIVDWSESFVL